MTLCGVCRTGCLLCNLGNRATWYHAAPRNLIPTIVGFTRIAVNFKFHSLFANFKLT